MEETVLFENEAQRDTLAETIFSQIEKLVIVKSLTFVGPSDQTHKTYPLRVWNAELSGEPETYEEHVAFYMPYGPFDSVEATDPADSDREGVFEGAEGEYLHLSWPGGAKWVRIWRSGQIELYGNECWFGAPTEAPVILPKANEAA